MEGSRAHPNLMEYINLTLRFYSRDTLAYALANYVSGLSSWRAVFTPLCFTIIGGWVMLSTLCHWVVFTLLIRLRWGLWGGGIITCGLLGMLKLREYPSSTSVRSGIHVLVVLVNMSRVEEIAMRVFRRRIDNLLARWGNCIQCLLMVKRRTREVQREGLCRTRA